MRPALASGFRGRQVEFDGPGDRARVIDVVVEFMTSGAAAVERQFPDVAAIEAELRSPCSAAMDDEVDDTGEVISRLVLLASLGRANELRTLLDASAEELAADGEQRLVRQLRRHIDAGCPAPPPIEQTLVLLPTRSRPPRPSWSRSRSEQAARAAARDAVRKKGRGRTVDELVVLLADEYRGRGVPMSPSQVRATAVSLHGEYRPLGRLLNAVNGIHTMVRATTDTIDAIRTFDHDQLDWLRPPDRATYPVVVEAGSYIGVLLDDDATDWLGRVHDGARRIASHALVDAWLTRWQDEIVVHIGSRRVGTIDGSDAVRFEPAFIAAGLFDEDPVVKARLARFQLQSFVLELQSPPTDTGEAGGPSG